MISPEQKRQLEILGYTDPEARVRIRCFAAKGMPLDEQLARGAAWQKDEKTTIPIPIEGWLYPSGRFIRLKKKRTNDEIELDANGNPLWSETKTYQDGIAYLRSLNAKGYGIYLIPNEGGGADADIYRLSALFYECDGISKDEQWQRLRSLEAKLGRSASMVVETRNSLHCYFGLAYGSLLPSTWTHYQQRLIQEQQSDEAIWNPARLMRLAGFDHQKWNGETGCLEQVPVRLADSSDNRFTLDEFDQILPVWDEERWQPRQQQREGVATDPSADPWDIRNFAHYLDGYRADGRRGWDTCKCPVHNGTSNDSLHVEQSTGAYKCHSGCDPKEIYHAALEVALGRGYQVPERRVAHRFSELGGWLLKLKRRLGETIERRKAWGFGRKGEVEVERESRKSPPAIEYQAGEQLQAWSEAVKNGGRNILVTDATGSGKSFYTGMATPQLFEAQQIIYVSAEHRNPTTPTLKSWADLEARHQGLRRDEFNKLRRAEMGQSYTISPNCGRNQVIGALRGKNISGADMAGLICETCPYLEPCRAGAVYGYLFDRARTLKQPRLRAHPDSLPAPAEYDYSDKVLFWDEAGETLKAHRSLSVTATDLQQAIAQLAIKLPPAFDTLRPLLVILYQHLSGEIKQPDKFGWKDAQIRTLLPNLDGVDVGAIAAALTPDVDSLLNTTSEHGVDLAELPAKLRKKFSNPDTETAARIERELALSWLPEFLDVLLGNVIGHLRIEHGKLIVTLRDERLSAIARAAKANVFLDATVYAEDLARVLDIDPESIVTMRQVLPDADNLEIVQVATMGRLGMSSRRKDKDGENTLLQKRIDAIIAQIQQDTPGKLAVIDFKRHTRAGDGKRHWWVDSRGSNDLEDRDALAIVGTPCRNLSELEAEFTILYGRPPQDGAERVKYPVQVKGQIPPDLQPWFEMEVSADPEFRAFVRRRILADIHQCFGRMRAHRRRGKQLKIFFIADYPLDLPVTLLKASDITPEAATKVERVEMAIRGAVQQLKQTGQKITQAALASLTGYSQQHISRFRSLLILLLNDSNSKMSKTSEPSLETNSSPPEANEMQWMSEQFLPLLAESPPEEMLDGVLMVFEAYGLTLWRQIWNAAPASVQLKILSVLLLTLTASELRLLASTALIAA